MSLSLVFNYILTHSKVKETFSTKKILTEKFMGGTKPTLYNKENPIENKPIPSSMTMSSDPRDISGQARLGWRRRKEKKK